MSTAPETDARISALLRRTLDHAEALAREVRQALGEDVYGDPCRRHGWRDCEDITCQRIAGAAAAAASAERGRCIKIAQEAATGLRDSTTNHAPWLIAADALEILAGVLSQDQRPAGKDH